MTDDLTDAITEKLLRGIKIPPQPQLMVDLQMEMIMPDVTLAQIAAIISKDIGISGATLKVINSPFFAMRSKITSIHQALSLLGLQNIVNIVNCLSLRNAFSYQDLMVMTKVWDNSLDVAMTCAAIAKLTGIASADEAYTLGLFHDSGITLLMNKFPDYPQLLKQAYQEPHLRITDIENSAIETNHAVVGYFVAKAWMLPDVLGRAIADHHKTEPIFADQIAYESRSKNLLAILKVAENTCRSHQALADTENHHEFDRIKRNLLLYLGMSEYDFDDLQAEVRDLLIHSKF
jgi:HD-like signal output (HDOD) protein